MEKLPVRPIPFADETTASFLIRASELNGHYSIQCISSQKIHKKVIKTLYGNRSYFYEILSDLGIKEKGSELAFESAGYTSKSPLIFSGVAINKRMFHSDVNTYCPECLLENPYWRRNWLLKPNYGCIKHKRLLTHGCNHCGYPLSPLRGLIFQCSNCNADIRDKLTDLTDISALSELQKLIADKNQSALDAVLNFFANYSSCNTDEISISTSKNSLEFAIGFFQKNKSIANKIAEHAIKNSPLMHPRLKFLPFLTSKNTDLQDLAKNILKLIPPHTYSDRGTNRALLNKSQACAFLAVSTAQLETLIKRGRIIWPYSSSGRAGKIHAYELIDHLTEKEASHCKSHKTTIRTDQKFLDIKNTAEKLDVHPEIVRSLIKNHWLPAQKITTNGNKKTMVSTDDLNEFMNSYILVGTLARKIGVNPTNLMEKIKYLGIHPIAGKGIDGLITSLFKLELVSHLDSRDIENISSYETKTGRPVTGSTKERKSDLHYSIPRAAKKLNISGQKILVLIKNGILEKHSKDNHRPISIKSKSLTALMRQLNRCDLIPINEAAMKLGISERKLTLNWISTEIVEVVNFGYWKFITTNSLIKIKELQSEYYNATEASLFFGMHRSYIPNLERRGLISSLSFHGKRSIRLYKISQLQKLKDNIDLLHIPTSQLQL